MTWILRQGGEFMREKIKCNACSGGDKSSNKLNVEGLNELISAFEEIGRELGGG